MPIVKYLYSNIFHKKTTVMRDHLTQSWKSTDLYEEILHFNVVKPVTKTTLWLNFLADGVSFKIGYIVTYIITSITAVLECMCLHQLIII